MQIKIFGAKGIFPFDKMKCVEKSMKHIFVSEIDGLCISRAYN